MSDDPDEFTPERAWEIYGKTMLVGISYLDGAGQLIKRKQFLGTVVRANPDEGIVLQLLDGTEYALPPTFRGIEKARPGEYQVRSTGEVIINPDYLCTYTSTRSRIN